MIQILLSLALVGCAWYGYAQRSNARFVSGGIALVSAMGLYFVWLPEQATTVARYVGVGRGADLVLYVWVVLSMAIGLNLHLKLNAQLRVITDLARHVALQEALARDVGEPSSRRNEDRPGDAAG
jgi:hypothetical protein